MKLTKGEFDAEKHAANKNAPGALPPGKYEGTLESLPEEETKGGRMALVVNIRVKPQGRIIKDWLNHKNKSQQAVDIAMDKLAQLSLACGVRKIKKDTDELVGRNLGVIIEVDGSYNRITRYVPSEIEETTDSVPDDLPNDDLPF